MTREERAWRKLCGGKPAPVRAAPAPEPTLLHPERLEDPRWQMHPWLKGGRLEFWRRNGWLLESRIKAHFEACERRSHTGTTGTAINTGLAPGVGNSAHHTAYSRTPPPPLDSQPQAGKAA